MQSQVADEPVMITIAIPVNRYQPVNKEPEKEPDKKDNPDIMPPEKPLQLHHNIFKEN